jgi:hypothetical protein
MRRPRRVVGRPEELGAQLVSHGNMLPCGVGSGLVPVTQWILSDLLAPMVLRLPFDN